MGRNPGCRSEKETIDGILTASDWDESGNVTEIKLLTFDDDEYLIENGDFFLNMVKKSVRVIGSVTQSGAEFKIIKIKKCSILEPL